MDPRALYDPEILAHDRDPRCSQALEVRTHYARVSNPLCGDRVDVELLVSGEHVKAISCQVRGCVIARASGSMMAERMQGWSVAKLMTHIGGFEAWLSQDDHSAHQQQIWAALVALRRVRSFPTRLPCVTLAWTGLVQALSSPVQEEA
ncbi:MAG: SUF system NifU family Fe-S cluster assembly protein [Myxococcales bacterium]|nr:SUF system NifU family Fe-S cluster assembly protein [Myxococcales bacterium]